MPTGPWTGEKMSKSTGNAVNPFFALDRFGTDVMRFYLVHDGGIQDDADYDNSYIITCYRRSLQGALGNLASRVTRGKSWRLRHAVQVGLDRSRWSPESWNHDFSQRLEGLPGRVQGKMNELNVGGALKEMMEVIYKVRLNCSTSYLNDTDDTTRPTFTYKSADLGM